MCEGIAGNAVAYKNRQLPVDVALVGLKVKTRFLPARRATRACGGGHAAQSAAGPGLGRTWWAQCAYAQACPRPSFRLRFRAAFFFYLCNLALPQVIAGRMGAAAPESQPAQEAERSQVGWLFWRGRSPARPRQREARGTRQRVALCLGRRRPRLFPPVLRVSSDWACPQGRAGRARAGMSGWVNGFATRRKRSV